MGPWGSPRETRMVNGMLVTDFDGDNGQPWGTPDVVQVAPDLVRRLLVSFEIDRGNGDIRRGRTEVEWTGPMNNLADIEGLEALIGEGEGGIVAIFGWQQFED